MLKQTVTIGAGHGGHDCGVIGSCGLKEKDVTLAIAKRAGHLLRKTGLFDVELIRSDDSYVDTDSRARRAKELKSDCHIEIHTGLFDGARSYAAVWHSADIMKDAPIASDLSRQLAKTLRVADGGAKARFDYSVLLSCMIHHEDYYSIIEKLQGYQVPHILFAECGHLDYIPTEESLSSPACINALALSIARAVCALLDEKARFKLWLSSLREPKKYPLYTDGKAVRLKNGIYNILSGPGQDFRLVRPIRGDIFTAYYEQEREWLKISREHEEYLSSLAVADHLNLEPCYKPPLVKPEGESRLERVRRSGFFYVRSEPDTRSAILGVVSGGESWITVNSKGWRKISFGERVGYVGAYAWE